YIDWVTLVHITSRNCQLLEMLCLLLSEAELQLEASECLLIALSRKGKLEERKPFMLLFNDVAIQYILSAAQHDTLSKVPVVLEMAIKYLKVSTTNLVRLGLQRVCKLPIDQSMELLQAVLNYETRDPLILSCVLSNISALFPFVTHRPQYLPQVLYKAPRGRAVKNVRRHACSAIIKICRDYPHFCLYAMLAVVKRARWPADLEEARAGGFVVGYNPAGAPIYRNPCAAQFLAFLPNLLALIRYILPPFPLFAPAASKSWVMQVQRCCRSSTLLTGWLKESLAQLSLPSTTCLTTDFAQ
ncbi:hypothetical protein XENOCAPTIV_000677, partial [Xenoophorus captivus]